MNLKRTILVLALSCGLAAAADVNLLNLIPKDPSMIAGVDVAQVKNSPFGQRVLAEMKDEDRGFKEFVELTGFDPRVHLREAVLATDGKTGENTVIVASGTFDPAKIGALLRQKGASPTSYAGVELWKVGKETNPDGAIAFVDSSTAVFGKDAAVKAALDRRGQGSALSVELQNRIKAWSVNDAWMITTASLSEMGVNSDGKNQVMPAGVVLQGIQAISAGVKFGQDVMVSGEAKARSAQDAQSLADVFKFVVGMIRLNADKPEANELLKVAETLQVSVNGVMVTFSLTVPEETIEKMMQRKAPAKRPRQVAAR